MLPPGSFVHSITDFQEKTEILQEKHIPGGSPSFHRIKRPVFGTDPFLPLRRDYRRRLIPSGRRSSRQRIIFSDPPGL
ncbi:MAG TPA: hypothetical protein DCF42_01085 [Lachnospiraceae bacterium]|nr:hypothetical protein [Lachnospiraceae bacterium]